MNKLNSIIWFECATSLKYIGIFYAIQYTIVLGVSLMIATNSFGNLEMNSLVYAGILGVLGFKEDFKMLIQHGFTRKYIFIATLALFAFISGILAIVDTITGNMLHGFMPEYSSIYGSIYGYETVVMNVLWLFMLYMFICSLAYLVVLIGNKLGQKRYIYAVIILGGATMLIVVLCRHFLSADVMNHILEVLMQFFGFSPNGAINYVTPILTLLLLVGVLSIGSYIVIRRTELK